MFKKQGNENELRKTLMSPGGTFFSYKRNSHLMFTETNTLDGGPRQHNPRKLSN